MILIGAGIILVLGSSPAARCGNHAQMHAHLHWSERTEVVSPNHAWRVEIHPVLTSNDNQTSVILRNCQTDQSHFLFTLQRDADLYWSPDSRYLLVVNEPLSGTNKLLLFQVDRFFKAARARSADQLDREVKSAVYQHLEKHEQIEFYLPQFVTWMGESVIVSVGGTTTFGGTGPMTPYCYGVIVNGDASRRESVMSGKELKAKFGAECTLFP